MPLGAPHSLGPPGSPPAAEVGIPMYASSFVCQAPASPGPEPSLVPGARQFTLPGKIVNQSGWELVNKNLSFLALSETIGRRVLYSLSEGPQGDRAQPPTAVACSVMHSLLPFPLSLSQFPNSSLCFLGPLQEINDLEPNPGLKACF